MLEMESKSKTNNKKNKKYISKKTCHLILLTQIIPLDTTGDSFDYDNDDFSVMCNFYFNAERKISIVTGFCAWKQIYRCSKSTMMILCTVNEINIV